MYGKLFTFYNSATTEIGLHNEWKYNRYNDVY